MNSKIFNIENIPTVLYGEPSKSCYLFIHGQGGNKFEAERFAKIATSFGYQVLAIDLPKHGIRVDKVDFVPWEVEKELKKVMKYAKQNWQKISIRATSIGVYFCLIALKNENIEKCLFVSPLLDMERTITDLMKLANVSQNQLESQKEIKTDFGQTLSWEYYCFACNNPVKPICSDTEILFATNDNIVPFDTVKYFAENNKCNLTLLKGAEHWIHSQNDVKQMEEWEKKHIGFRH